MEIAIPNAVSAAVYIRNRSFFPPSLSVNNLFCNGTDMTVRLQSKRSQTKEAWQLWQSIVSRLRHSLDVEIVKVSFNTELAGVGLEKGDSIDIDINNPDLGAYFSVWVIIKQIALFSFGVTRSRFFVCYGRNNIRGSRNDSL